MASFRIAEHRQIWPPYLQTKLLANVIILLLTQKSPREQVVPEPPLKPCQVPRPQLSPHIHTVLPLSPGASCL